MGFFRIPKGTAWGFSRALISIPFLSIKNCRRAEVIIPARFYIVAILSSGLRGVDIEGVRFYIIKSIKRF